MGGTTECPFVCPIDLPPPMFECDTWAQDCPVGQKCSLQWDTAPSGSHCVPLAPDPKQPGDSCEHTGDPQDGVDDCDIGATCIFPYGVEDARECVANCQGIPVDPTCPPGYHCVIAGNGEPHWCLEACRVFVQSDCPEGQKCGFDPVHPDQVACSPDASADEGQVFDPCADDSACDPGLVCLAPMAASGCVQDAPGCCLPLCDLFAFQTGECEAPLTCVPWFPPDATPPLLANIGVCREP